MEPDYEHIANVARTTADMAQALKKARPIVAKHIERAVYVDDHAISVLVDIDSALVEYERLWVRAD